MWRFVRNTMILTAVAALVIALTMNGWGVL